MISINKNNGSISRNNSTDTDTAPREEGELGLCTAMSSTCAFDFLLYHSYYYHRYYYRHSCYYYYRCCYFTGTYRWCLLTYLYAAFPCSHFATLDRTSLSVVHDSSVDPNVTQLVCLFSLET